MKKLYNEPMLDLTLIESADIIRTSGENGDCYEADKFPPLA